MNKNKIMGPPKPIRAKTATTRPTSTPNELNATRKIIPRAKINRNSTILDLDSTIKPEGSQEYDVTYHEIAYAKFIQQNLEQCIFEEKIEKKENEIEMQMCQLADRFQKTLNHLDKTNRRLKSIQFVVEQQRLLNLKSQDCSTFYNMIDNSDVEDKLNNLKIAEESCLDKLETKNVDFGYDKETGHKQLLDAVNDAIEGLEQIKKHSNLDDKHFTEYEKVDKNLCDVEKDRFDIESLKSEFLSKFPLFSEKLLKEISEKIASVMDEE